MSALTKLFVVLHVVLSMLLAAGLVVFVNRVDDFRTLNTNLSSQLTLAKASVEAARSEASTSSNSAALAVQSANAETASVRTELGAANRQLLDSKGQVAQANAQLASVQAALQGAQAALAAAQANQGVLQTQQLDIRKAADEAQRKLTDANLAISDLSNRNQVLERQLRNAQEEIAALQDPAQSGTPRAAASAAGDAAVTAGDTGLNINGVIRATQTIAGIKYATISVGSADAVRKGMKFRVLGGPAGNQFLGYVTVTSVEPHEAVGRLEGPRVNEVATDNQVRTRL